MCVLGRVLNIIRVVYSFYIDTSGDKHIKPALTGSEILFLPFRICQDVVHVACCLSLSASPQRIPRAAVCLAVSAPWSHCGPWAVSQYVLSLVTLVFQKAATALCSEKSPSW